MIVEARPDHPFSTAYQVAQDGEPITTLDLAHFRSRGRFTVDGTEYRVRAVGWTAGVFTLDAAGRELARAERASFLPLSYRVRLEDRWLELRARGLGRSFSVVHGGRTVGTIRPRRLFSRTALFEGADDVAIPVRVFLLTVALLRWRRRARASSGG